LENVIKSYLNQEDERIFGRSRRGDPDLEEAEAELENFLRGGGGRDWSDSRDRGAADGAWGESRRNTGDWSDSRDRKAAGGTGGARSENRTGAQTRGAMTEQVRRDFAELGLPPGAGGEDCKAAYRRLLKLHHPDRHAGHQRDMEKATDKMARINAAYDRIEKWREEELRRGL
jgi:DnaJ-domain-containing protein 1